MFVNVRLCYVGICFSGMFVYVLFVVRWSYVCGVFVHVSFLWWGYVCVCVFWNVCGMFVKCLCIFVGGMIVVCLWYVCVCLRMLEFVCKWLSLCSCCACYVCVC